ncbi:MAG: SMI1/KNR4 family protein, partial [Treponemataceae bacterium]|nr:SMI1/KNR4 family protein [Treponemataceae bacterium]
MKTAEQFKEILARYYQRDEETKKLYEEFTAYSYAPLNDLLDAMPRIEEKFNLKLPDEYKTFIEADSAWGMYGAAEDFRIYDEDEIYEFNNIGNHEGDSSIEEMKDYFMFGQDGGE